MTLHISIQRSYVIDPDGGKYVYALNDRAMGLITKQAAISLLLLDLHEHERTTNRQVVDSP